MKLSRIERLLLSNQYSILEKIYPDRGNFYQHVREIVENGYELHYDEILQHIYEDSISPEVSKRVIGILDMFQSLQRSYKKLEDKSGIEDWSMRFSGFDGNDRIEANCLGYARFFCSLPGSRFSDLDKEDDFNSHMPTLSRYTKMLEEWQKSQNKYELSKEDIIRITSVR